ncbi:MAG: hypothetical protein AB1425_16205 [Actinomycetota bacterium]
MVSYRTRSGATGALAVEPLGFRAVSPPPVATDQERARYRRKLEEWAAYELRRLHEAGATLDDVLGGEAGRRWVSEACAGDAALAEAAFRMVHPGAAFGRDPFGESGDIAATFFADPQAEDP